MKKRMAKILAAVAMLATAGASMGCMIWFAEEPKALKNMDQLLKNHITFNVIFYFNQV